MEKSPMVALSVYLTSLGNYPAVQEQRVWKRFLRVRADDMSSVRVRPRLSFFRLGLFKRIFFDVLTLYSSLGQQVERKIPLAQSALGLLLSQPVCDRRLRPPPSSKNMSKGTNGDDDVFTSLQNQPEEEEEDQRAEGGLFHEKFSLCSNGVEGLPLSGLCSSLQDLPSKRNSSLVVDSSKEETNSLARSSMNKVRASKGKKTEISDFELIRVVGKGCAGKVSPIFFED